MRNTVILGAALTASFLAIHCGSDSASCDETGTCTPTGDGGTDAPGMTDVTPNGCDPTADPKDAPLCVVDSFGVFVDGTNGSDQAAGTKEAPFKTINGALATLGGKSRVYICAATYAEHVKLTSAVSLYGGFTCGSWNYDATAQISVAPKDAGPALQAIGATSAVSIEDMSFTAIDGVASGESSIGAFIVSSTQVTFKRATITAGKGVDGMDGAAISGFAGPAPDGTPGAPPASPPNPGQATSNPQCVTSIGGAGGNNTVPAGGPGLVTAVTIYPDGDTGVGGVGGEPCGQTGPRDGSYGTSGTPGVGASTIGVLIADGWKGSDGSTGGKGGDGQGGGGGAQRVSGGVGGSGGPGGCGGGGGINGTSGGSSIALLVFQSVVALTSTTLSATDAGRGGNGGKGQTGQLNQSAPAAPNTIGIACAGGVGGIGGSGGGGGGGAGGVSVGIFYKGTAPNIEMSTVSDSDQIAGITLGKQGVAGMKGPGGDAAQTLGNASRAGADGADGVPGEIKAVTAAP